MDEPRIDLSALDLGRDPARYERMVQAVLAGARPPAHPLLAALVGRGRVAVACALLAAGAAWLPALRRGASTPAAQSATDPVALVSDWARAGAIPTDADLLQVLEHTDGR